MVTCAKCGVENADGSSNCRMCGNRLVVDARHCVSCGRSIDWNANVCPYCGHDFRITMTGQAPKTVSTGLRIVLYLLSILVSIVGIVVGIIYLTRDSPDEKHVGKICLILGVLGIVVSVVCAAALYVMVLGFGSDGGVSTPAAILTRTPVTDGYRFTFNAVSADISWSDISIVLNDGLESVSWSVSSSDLEGGLGTTYVYPARVLGSITVSLSVQDLVGDGRLDSGDNFTLKSLDGFSTTTSYTVTAIYEPTNEEMCYSVFSGV